MKFAYFTHVWGKPGMTPAKRYDQLWRELALADELGIEYGFCVEHHFSPHESWMSAPNLFALGGGMHTKRMRLGGMGHVVPLHQSLRLAEEIAIVDQMLGGRFDIGLVSGVSPTPFGPFGADFETRREVTIEFIDFLKAAYADGKPFDFAGRHHKAKGVKLSVQPTQRPHPPIWLETRDPGTLAVCAREGFNTGYFFVFRRDEVAPVYRLFLDQWKAAGWNRKPNIGYSTTVYVDETDEKAVTNGLWDASQAYRGFFAGVSDDKAELKKAQQAAGDRYAERGEHGTADIMRHLLDPEYLLEKDLILVGSPETVARKLKAYATEGVFNTFLGEFNFGALPEEHLMRSIRLFATEVAPKLRDFEPF